LTKGTQSTFFLGALYKEKNLLLKRERNLSFEQIVLHIENGDERF